MVFTSGWWWIINDVDILFIFWVPFALAALTHRKAWSRCFSSSFALLYFCCTNSNTFTNQIYLFSSLNSFVDGFYFFFFLSSPSFTAHPYTDTQTLANAQFITNWIVNTNSMMKLGILFCILISLQAKTIVHSNPRIIQISVAILCYVWVFFSSFIIENRAALKSAHRTNPGQFRFSTELALT